MKCCSHVFSLALTLAVLFSVSSAEAQTVPFSGSGTSAVYMPGTGTYSGEGEYSLMGKAQSVGIIVPVGVFFPEPGVFFAGTFSGSQVTTAANGDTLETAVSGEVVLNIDPTTGAATGIWAVTWDVTGGTGRFANASGSYSGYAVNPPFDPTSGEWLFDYAFEGTLDLGK